jgi:DNA-binding MarR family transcriptional regulator
VRVATHRQSSLQKQPSLRNWPVEATAFLHEIVMTADGLRQARSFDGDPALYFGPRWTLLRAIERCGGAPTFSELGRLMRISKQAARGHALEAAQTGLVETFPAHDDRRALQVMLTPAGRHTVEARRVPDSVWLATLLNGLEPTAMREAHDVLRVMRLRLERYERYEKERRRISAASARR